jgi:transcriptional regulator with XRE-family HTH domain
MNNIALRFGLALRQLREQRGWSQEGLAEYANLNRSYVGELERGQALASIATLEKLAQAFNLSSAALMAQAERASETPTSRPPP